MASKTTAVAIFGLIAFVSSVVLSCVLWGACRATVANYYVNNKEHVLGVLFSIAPKFFLIIILFIASVAS